MSVIQIPNLGSAVALNGTEQLEGVQAGTSVKLTIAQIGTYINAQYPPPGVSSIATSAPITGGTITTTGTIGLAGAGVTNTYLATMAAGTVKANVTGGSAQPTDATPSAVLDIFSSATGRMLYRSAGGWTSLAIGSPNYILSTNGVTPQWVDFDSLHTLTIGTTPISGGTSGRVLYDNGGVLGEYPVTGTAGNVVLSTGPTLSAPKFSTIVNTGTLTLPTATDTLVARATTDTLTNKTISGSSNTLSNIGNASLTNSSITINGSSVSLGNSVTVTAAASSVTVGTTTVASGTSGYVLYNNAGTLGNFALGTGVQTALGSNVGAAGAFVVNGGALGTPSSGTLTNAIGLPVSTGISGFGTGVATALATNIGSAGAFVANGGALGTPSSGTLTNATGLPLSTGVTGTLPILNGGTGQTTANAAFNALAPSQGAGNAGKFLTTNGTDTSWASPVAAAASITVGTTTVIGGTDTYILYNNAGLLGNVATTGTGSVVRAGSPALTGTPTFAGATSGTIGLVATAIAGSNTLTLPAATDTLVARETTDTLKNKTISGANNTLSNIGNSSLTNSSITINGSSVSLGGSVTITAAAASVTVGTTAVASGTDTYLLYNNAGTLGNVATTGTGNVVRAGSPALTGTPTFAGATSGAIGLVATAIAGSNTLTLPAATDTLVARETTDTLKNKTISGADNTLSNIGNSSLTNSSITVNGTTIALGGSGTITAAATSVTVGTTTVASGTDTYVLYNNAGTLGNVATTGTGNVVRAGSPALTGTPTIAGATSGTIGLVATAIAGSNTLTLPAATDTLVARETTDTLKNKTISGSSNTLSNIGNSSLTNSSITVNGTSISLGGSGTVTAAASSVTVGTTTVGSGTNGYILYNNSGTLGNLSTTGTAGSVVLSAGPTITGTLSTANQTITSASANALAVGPNGTTNPTFNIDASTASAATGLNIKSAAAAGGLALSVLSSGTNENLKLDAKGSGTITIGGTSTGAITLTRATTLSAALTYGGVTLSNSVTGTGSMVLSASPTLSGTIGLASGAAFSGQILNGTTNTNLAGNGVNYLIGLDGQNSNYTLVTYNSTTGSATHFVFVNGNGIVGSISTSGSATAFNTSSDRKLKTNFRAYDPTGPLFDALRVWEFDWKASGETQRYGMVAQEVHELYPDAVTPGDENNNWGIDYSKFVPLLIAEIKDLRGRLADVETRLAAMERNE